MVEQENRIEFERICLLYSSAPKIIAGSGMLSIFIAFFLSGFIPLNILAMWLTVALVAQLPRLVLARVFRAGLLSENIGPDNIGKHEFRWLLATIPVSIILSATVFFPVDGTQLVIITLFITFICAGNILNSGSSLKTVAIDNAILVVPAIIKLLLSSYTYSFTVGMIYIALVIVFASYTLSLNHVLVENIRYKINSENLSLYDPLTRLNNRRGLEIFVERLVPRSDRTGIPFGLMLIDIDHFKKYNDTYGHGAGDDALVSVAEVLVQETRKDDFVSRYGGEEFMVILPDTRLDMLQQTAQRICDAVKRDTDVTISAGLASYSNRIEFDDLVERADKALYAAKQAGRDRFVLAG